MVAIPPVQVVIQARLGSSRLPGKALLPVAGLPAAVLCAKRAIEGCHYPVTVAIPDTPDDDPLADALHHHQVPTIRGPYEDVLARFIAATSHLPNTAWVVRLTADNVLPDGHFINGLIEAFAHHQADTPTEYMTTLGEESPLPHGATAEVITIAALRHAHQHATQAPHREHVTAYTLQHGQPTLFLPKDDAFPNYKHLRVTLDIWPDYLRLQQLFAGIDAPITTPWTTLCRKLPTLPDAPAFAVPSATKAGIRVSRLGLCPNNPTAPMVAMAVSHGVSVIHAPPGAAQQQALAKALPPSATRQELTLVIPLPVIAAALPHNATAATVSLVVQQAVLQRCWQLSQPLLPVVLMAWEDLFGNSPHCQAIRQALAAEQHEGRIGQLGVAASTQQHATLALKDNTLSWLRLAIDSDAPNWITTPAWQAACHQHPQVIIEAHTTANARAAKALYNTPTVDTVTLPADTEKDLVAVLAWVNPTPTADA